MEYTFRKISKRIFDLVLSMMGIFLLFPLFFAIGIWIALDSPGPILFRQIRVGRFGREFTIYKFRTMVVNSELLGKGKQLTAQDDQRITKSGQFIRKYKLDELPQLFNVLKGDMSLVGPRPEVPRYVAFYTPEQRRVLNVHPGITDLGSLESITLRNENKLLAGVDDPEQLYIQKIMPQKLKSSLKYVERSSVSFDIQIILKTLWHLLFQLEDKTP